MATITGYSDRIHHAFAFAAKHQDQQVRKGTRFPYLTHAPSMAVILTRYGLDEDTVVAGILFDVVRDGIRGALSQKMAVGRIGDKFGTGVVDTVLAAVERRCNDEGIDLSQDERKEDLLARLASASESSLWVCAADAVHNASSVLADLRRTEFPDTMWSRFSAGKEGTIRWYRALLDRLVKIGFSAPIMQELRHVVEALETSPEPSNHFTQGRAATTR